MRARTRRRFVRRPPDLTSLFDVMFIVVFVALIRAAAAQSAVAAALAPPKPKPVIVTPPLPPPPVAVAQLRTRALASLNSDLETRTPVVIRVSAKGTAEAIEIGDKRITLDVPLLEQSADQFVISYLGDRSAELRMCRIAAVHLAVADLSKHIVIIAPAQRFADGIIALNEGLTRDVGRCLTEQHGLAVIVDPTPVAKP